MKRVLIAGAVLALACTSAHADVGDKARVVTYRCANGHRIVVGYPENPSARRATVRIAWQGRTVLLERTGSLGTGERYLNALAGLEWWSSPNRSELRNPANKRALLSDCHPES